MKPHKFIGLLLASLLLPLLLWACDPDEDDDSSGGGSTALTISSAAYDASTGELTLSGSNLPISANLQLAKVKVNVKDGTPIALNASPAATIKSGNENRTASKHVYVVNNTNIRYMFDANGKSNIAGKAYNLKLEDNWATNSTGTAKATTAITVKGVDESAIQLKDAELANGYYTYTNGTGDDLKYYIAVPNTLPDWDYLNVTADAGIAANNAKFKAPLGAKVEAYKSNGTTKVTLADANLANGYILKVTKGSSSREYIIKRRGAAANAVAVIDPTNTNYAYVAGTGTDSVKVMVGGTFANKRAFVKTGTGGTPSKKPGDYTDAGASGADVSSVRAGDKFFLIVKRDGATPASMPSAAVVATAAPSQGTAADDNDEYRLAASRSVNALLVQVDSLYEFQFASSNAGADKGTRSVADGWTTGAYNNTRGIALANMLKAAKDTKATHIRLRLKSTPAKAGLTTAWVDAQPPALKKSKVTWYYPLADLGSGATLNAKEALGTTTDYANNLGSAPKFKLFTENPRWAQADRAEINTDTGVITVRGSGGSIGHGNSYQFTTVIGSTGKPDTLPITVTINVDGNSPTAVIATTLTNRTPITSLDIQFDEVLPDSVISDTTVGNIIASLTRDADSADGTGGASLAVTSITWGKKGGGGADDPHSKLTLFFISTTPAMGKYWVVDFANKVADAAGNTVANISKAVG